MIMTKFTYHCDSPSIVAIFINYLQGDYTNVEKEIFLFILRKHIPRFYCTVGNSVVQQ